MTCAYMYLAYLNKPSTLHSNSNSLHTCQSLFYVFILFKDDKVIIFSSLLLYAHPKIFYNNKEQQLIFYNNTKAFHLELCFYT